MKKDPDEQTRQILEARKKQKEPMFTFAADVPTNLHGFLIPLLAAWIGRKDHPLHSIETPRYGLVTFRRTPWPSADPTVVSPAGEVDTAALQAFSATL